MATIHLLNQKSFAARADQTILDAAQAAGLALEHSCRNGRCGSCRTQVIAGQSQPLLPEDGLTQQEKDAGWILSCARAALTDLQLDLQDLGALAGIRRATVPCRIHSLQLLAPDVLQVRLRLPPNAAFQYLAGQHVSIIGKGGQRRSYSLATACTPAAGADAAAPAEAGLLELHIRRVEQGAMSHYWFAQAQVNDLLRLDGPLGSFYLRDVSGQDLVFLATGTGIAPIKAMLAELERRPAAQHPRSLQLLWGGRQASDLYALPQPAGLLYTPVLSRADAAWQGARGHVQQVLLQQAPRDWAHTHVYACGSPAMVQGARASLLAAGLQASRFFADAFVASDNATTSAPDSSNPGSPSPVSPPHNARAPATA